MTVTAKDYVDAAETLAVGRAEIDWRNAISRAYYGAFNWASKQVEPYCKPLPYGVQPAGSHDRVILRYQHHDERPAQLIAYVLSDMKRKRKIADYSLDYTVRPIDAKICVESGRKTIREISKIAGVLCPYAEPEVIDTV